MCRASTQQRYPSSCQQGQRNWRRSISFPHWLWNGNDCRFTCPIRTPCLRLGCNDENAFRCQSDTSPLLCLLSSTLSDLQRQSGSMSRTTYNQKPRYGVLDHASPPNASHTANARRQSHDLQPANDQSTTSDMSTHTLSFAIQMFQELEILMNEALEWYWNRELEKYVTLNESLQRKVVPGRPSHDVPSMSRMVNLGLSVLENVLLYACCFRPLLQKLPRIKIDTPSWDLTIPLSQRYKQEYRRTREALIQQLRRRS